MPTPPSDTEYLNYIPRFWGKLSEHLFRLGGEHVLGAALAIAILCFQRYYGLIPADHGWKEIKSIGWPYAVLVGALLLLSFVRATVELDSEGQKRIYELLKRLEFPDEALAEHLRELLRHVGENGKKVLRFILWHGEMTAPQIKIPEMTDKEIYASIELCISENLLRCRSEAPITASSSMAYMRGIVIRTNYYFVRKRSVWAVWTGLLLVGILPSGHSGGVHLEDRWMLAMPQ